MRIQLLVILICICSTQMFYSQEDDGVVALNLPIRNSLTFNRFAINPTFSFVREQSRYISIYNKREWVQFDYSPLTYLASYSGRFGENIGAGLGLFQQNYGVLTTFGGILNFAYNAQLGRDNNLTLGINVGAYQSGINLSNVITNYDDPSLQNVPENILLTINPGINYGTEFLDFGVSINNLALYNLNSSELIQDDQKQSIQAHLLYTGYMDSRGFFDESKFSGLLRSEFQKDETIISAIAMLTVPKGIWAQLGYNTRYGISGGLGINISKQLAIEYNFEKTVGDLDLFGSSHDITLAYRFISKQRYYYGSDDEIVAFISKGKNSRKSKPISKEKSEANKKLLEQRRLKAKLEREDRTKRLAQREADKKSQSTSLSAENTNQTDTTSLILTDNEANEVVKQIAEEEAELRTRAIEEQKAFAKKEAEALAKQLAEQKEKEAAEERARLLEVEKATLKAQAEAEALAKQLAEQKEKEEAEERARLIKEEKATLKAQAEAEELAKQLAEQKEKVEAEERARLIEEEKARTKLLEEQQALEAEENTNRLALQETREESDIDTIAQVESSEQPTLDKLVVNPNDKIGQSMKDLTQLTEGNEQTQNNLLERFNAIIDIKDQDLKNLKEENDLSDQGIAVQPRPFKSVTAENNRLNAIKKELDNVISSQNHKLDELTELYNERVKEDDYSSDELTLYYRKEIKRLKAEQLNAIGTRAKLESQLEKIRVATEFERRRRIKRAAFDNEEDRYSQDRLTLNNIKRTTSISETPLNVNDFDFGEALGNNIKILKNIKNIESGYYLIIAVHSDVEKRNDFVTKVIASGRNNVDFFYDVNTSKYYIYYDKFNSIDYANEAMKSKGNRPYNEKMSLVKIEN